MWWLLALAAKYPSPHLPANATDCPVDWTPSPVSATCFFVPLERSTSFFRCVDLCEEHGGTPACIGSAEENAFVTAELAAADGLWLGLYQNETGLGPAKGWDRCVEGDAPNFTNWQEGQPDDYHGYQQDCAWVEAGTGRWRALACDGVRFDPLPWKLWPSSPACAPTATPRPTLPTIGRHWRQPAATTSGSSGGER